MGLLNTTSCDLIFPIFTIIRVWERGVGPTLACGTGASAAAVVAAALGHADPKLPVTVHLLGGDLTLRLDLTDCSASRQWSLLAPTERTTLVDRVWMDGPAVIVFDGSLTVYPISETEILF